MGQPAKPLLFLKLGGSLITDKARPHTARLDTLTRLVDELASFKLANPDAQVLLGHGSGSFGHIPAQRHSTREGVRSEDEWTGFAEVWRQANALNRIVVDALGRGGLNAISFSPSGCVLARDGLVASWDLAPIQVALEAGLLPVVHGDVVFDSLLGGTILSTEDLFTHLALSLAPERILLAGLEPGVWADFPECTQLIPEITENNYHHITSALAGSANIDVTGGMASKVRQSLDLAREISGLEIIIFSGERPGEILKTLHGKTLGTVIRTDRV